MSCFRKRKTTVGCRVEFVRLGRKWWHYGRNSTAGSELARWVNQVRKCRARGGRVKTDARSFSSAKRIDCAAVELQRVPRKVFSEGRI